MSRAAKKGRASAAKRPIERAARSTDAAACFAEGHAAFGAGVDKNPHEGASGENDWQRGYNQAAIAAGIAARPALALLSRLHDMEEALHLGARMAEYRLKIRKLGFAEINQARTAKRYLENAIEFVAKTRSDLRGPDGDGGGDE